jgi:hypothetical protein
MKTNYKLVQAVLAGVSIGVAGVKAIHAQQVKTPPAYPSEMMRVKSIGRLPSAGPLIENLYADDYLFLTIALINAYISKQRAL